MRGLGRPRARARGKKVFLRQDSNVFPCGAFAPRLLSARWVCHAEKFGSIILGFLRQYDLRPSVCFQSGSKKEWARLKKRRDTRFFDSRAKRRRNGHSSPADAVSIGSGALYRRNGTVHSSVRSHHTVASHPDVPRHHHCRPVALFVGVWGAPHGQISWMLSLGVADGRIWMV